MKSSTKREVKKKNFPSLNKSANVVKSRIIHNCILSEEEEEEKEALKIDGRRGEEKEKKMKKNIKAGLGLDFGFSVFGFMVNNGFGLWF